MFFDTKLMSHRRCLSSFSSQQLNGNVRKLSEKFENLLEIKRQSSEELFSPKSQLFTSFYKSFENSNQKKKIHILMTRSNTISIYNTNANTSSDHSLEESVKSIRQCLLDLLTNKNLIRIFKQLLIGGSVGAFAGSLLEQTNFRAKLIGVLTVTLFIGEHIAHFTQWTLFNFGKLEYNHAKVPYSTTFGLMKNIDNFFDDNMPTIISFLFTSILSSTIKINFWNKILNLPFIDQQKYQRNMCPHQINIDRSCLCPYHYQSSTQMQFIPVFSSTNKTCHTYSSS